MTKLEQARIDAGLTVEQLAEASGVSKWTVYKIESGNTRRPAVKTLVDLANVLGVAPSSLTAKVDYRNVA